MTSYFLSYARADAEQALRLADDLIAAGVSVWVDQYDIRPSQHWDRAVETAVRACRGMIVVISPRATQSPNVADEVSVAIDDGKDLIPILIETCALPLRLTRMQYIDATRDYQDALRRCLEAIARAGHAVQPPPPVAGPAAPVLSPESLRDAERRLIGFIGPIAAVLVRQAAGRVANEAELYRALARSIDAPADREAFLGWIEEPRTPGKVVTARKASDEEPAPPGPISARDLAAITGALTRHLGPIASHIVARERAAAGSKLDLCRKLAARIPDEKHRTDFLRETAASL